MHTPYASGTLRPERGFTIIELLVVISIIAILAALTLAALSSAQKGSRDAKRKSDLNQYKTALAQYQSDKDSYPGRTPSGAISTSTQPWTALGTGGAEYMKAFIDDEKSGQHYYYGSLGVDNFGMCADLEREAGTRFQVGPTISETAVGAASACPQAVN